MKWLAAVLLVGCAADEERTKPAPPDMDALIAGYRMPTATLDTQTATEVKNLVETKVRQLADVAVLADRIEETLGALAEDNNARIAPVRSVVLEGDGFARIERICTGFGNPAPAIDKDANGFLELTAGFSSDGIDPIVFGGARDCREQAGAQELSVAGDVNLFIGEGVGIQDLASTPFIFELANFAFTVNGTEVVSGGFDFEICRGTATTCVPGHFELLLGLGDGTNIVFFIDLATKTGGFRAANGVWTCEFPSGECTDGGGGMVTIPVFQL